jgi:hypothetical protein
MSFRATDETPLLHDGDIAPSSQQQKMSLRRLVGGLVCVLIIVACSIGMSELVQGLQTRYFVSNNVFHIDQVFHFIPTPQPRFYENQWRSNSRVKFFFIELYLFHTLRI